jgi:hypothetical protein
LIAPIAASSDPSLPKLPAPNRPNKAILRGSIGSGTDGIKMTSLLVQVCISAINHQRHTAALEPTAKMICMHTETQFFLDRA